MKEELIKRYKYLYENSHYILAPYMHQQTDREFWAYIKKYKTDITKPIIYLRSLDSEKLLKIEEFLLSEDKMENTKLFVELETNKQQRIFLAYVGAGMELLKKMNSEYSSEELHVKLDLKLLLCEARKFIFDQTGDKKNRELKLSALDEYFRILRYSNDGMLWTSGYRMSAHDTRNFAHFSFIGHENIKPSRNKKDIGLKNNEFINFLSNESNKHEDNYCILTEEEKQDIYLEYHDELPWNLEICCSGKTLPQTENTQPCGNEFTVKESEIFIKSDEKNDRYYQICSHCGCIVNIPRELLTDGVIESIEKRCSKDKFLFRKMCLYSELFGLDKQSTEDQKRFILK